MDTQVATEIQNTLANFRDAAMAQLDTLIPVAAVVLITVALVFALVKWFRALTHM